MSIVRVEIIDPKKEEPESNLRLLETGLFFKKQKIFLESSGESVCEDAMDVDEFCSRVKRGPLGTIKFQ